MPANPSTNKAQRKRLQITDTAGWTHIVKGSQAQKNQKHLTPTHQLRPTQLPKGLTLQKACDVLKRYRNMWGECNRHAQLKDILERQFFVREGLSITRCVCLGLGSMTGTATEESSWYQLAFLISVLEILGTKQKIEQIYVQDPMFNHVDMALLQTLGCTILETPDAFDKMTGDTFLFDPHLEWKHTVRALDVAHPSLRIGNMILNEITCSEHMTSQEKESMQRYADTHVETAVPGARDSRWSSSLAIFWPRPPDLESELPASCSTVEQGSIGTK